MKILVQEQENIFCMSKIVERKADMRRTGKIHDFIYFSECNDTHGPRIKFYGGTSETKNIRNAPSMAFGVTGEPEVVIFDWMNKKNCPRAFDDTVLQDIRNFIVKNRPILLLVWFDKLDESDALDYFHGNMDWEEMLQYVQWNDLKIEHICKNMYELNELCMNENMYQF